MGQMAQLQGFMQQMAAMQQAMQVPGLTSLHAQMAMMFIAVFSALCIAATPQQAVLSLHHLSGKSALGKSTPASLLRSHLLCSITSTEAHPVGWRCVDLQEERILVLQKGTIS